MKTTNPNFVYRINTCIGKTFLTAIVLTFAVLVLSTGHVKAQAPQKDSTEAWSYHFQLTTIYQSHPSFTSPYEGPKSLSPKQEEAISLTTTLFLGRKLWKGGAIYINPEIAGGKGLSGAMGIAGFTNGETFRIGDPAPALYLGRAFLKQHIKLGSSTRTETLAPDQNQLAEIVPATRLDITIGKLALADIFDDNNVSHDPRSDLLNWSLMSNGAWDYPANTRGYTGVFAVEWIHPGWTLRAAEALEPTYANGPKLEGHLSKAHSETIEFEKKYNLGQRPGVVRILGFRNSTAAPSYKSAIGQLAVADSSDLFIISGVNKGMQANGIKYGFGVNADQQFADNFTAFLRAGWNDGRTATWAFTEIDRTISAGVKLTGNAWKRQNDFISVASVINGISKEHQDYLSVGGYGFIVGDGKLNYGTEKIVEVLYSAQLFPSLFLSVDYQFVSNPAYNKDRGPVNVFAVRTHIAL